MIIIIQPLTTLFNCDKRLCEYQKVGCNKSPLFCLVIISCALSSKNMPSEQHIFQNEHWRVVRIDIMVKNCSLGPSGEMRLVRLGQHYIKCSHHFKTWQAPAKIQNDWKTTLNGAIETLRDLTIRRLMVYWNETMGVFFWIRVHFGATPLPEPMVTFRKTKS